MSTPLERFPTPEDWVGMQGGKPTILGKPDLTGNFYVIHDYGEGRLPQSGMIIPTTNRQMLESVRNPVEVVYVRQRRLHEARVPAVLLAEHHGLACGRKSFEADRGDTYAVLTSKTPQDIAEATGLVALKLSVDKTGVQYLQPLQ